jgi:hypothetical protein
MSASKKWIRFVSTPTRKGWPSRALVSSARLYWHSLASSVGSFDKVPASSAYSRFSAETLPCPSVGRAAVSPIYATTALLPGAGHFAAYDAPSEFVTEVRAGLRALVSVSLSA